MDRLVPHQRKTRGLHLNLPPKTQAAILLTMATLGTLAGLVMDPAMVVIRGTAAVHREAIQKIPNAVTRASQHARMAAAVVVLPDPEQAEVNPVQKNRVPSAASPENLPVQSK